MKKATELAMRLLAIVADLAYGARRPVQLEEDVEEPGWTGPACHAIACLMNAVDDEDAVELARGIIRRVSRAVKWSGMEPDRELVIGCAMCGLAAWIVAAENEGGRPVSEEHVAFLARQEAKGVRLTFSPSVRMSDVMPVGEFLQELASGESKLAAASLMILGLSAYLQAKAISVLEAGSGPDEMRKAIEAGHANVRSGLLDESWSTPVMQRAWNIAMMAAIHLSDSDSQIALPSRFAAYALPLAAVISAHTMGRE